MEERPIHQREVDALGNTCMCRVVKRCLMPAKLMVMDACMPCSSQDKTSARRHHGMNSG